jgi:hypothetical protein
VEVVLREETHEKIAIIDKQILWDGSLNILSHKDGPESMNRFDDPKKCQRKEVIVGNYLAPQFFAYSKATENKLLRYISPVVDRP